MLKTLCVFLTVEPICRTQKTRSYKVLSVLCSWCGLNYRRKQSRRVHLKTLIIMVVCSALVCLCLTCLKILIERYYSRFLNMSITWFAAFNGDILEDMTSFSRMESSLVMASEP